jgi:hypothetical protein
MSIQLFQDAIAKRRQENEGCDWLSDWQVHSAHVTAGAIESLASGLEVGPLYVPMPTGSGKTTGAIWGMIDFANKYPSQRLCFLTPYKESVSKIHQELVNKLGSGVVGHYHRDAFVDKDEELSKRLVVLTHQFIQHNQGRLDDRDLFVVDEAIYATGEATLKLEHFSQGRSWATKNNVLSEEFVELYDFAFELDRQLRASDKKYVAPSHDDDLIWAKAIAFDLKLSDHSQTIENNDALVATQRFCEALLEGLVFLSKGSIDKDRFDPIYSAAVLGIPRIDKTVVLSATGGMVYDIAGPFKQDQGSRDSWTRPSYKNLKLVQLSGPDITGQYRTWSAPTKMDKAVDYVDWLLSEIPETKIYMTMPKQVIDACFRRYFEQPTKGDLSYPINLNKHGKQISVSHHARSVGSNEFKDCEAVIYLWDNHLPQGVAIQRFHTLADKEITDEALEDANGGHLVGDYSRIRDVQYIDNMMQQIGRGRVRNIDQDGVAGTMTAYVFTDSAKFERLAVNYTDCATEKMEYQGATISEPTDRVARILAHIRQQDTKADIPTTEVESALGFRLSSYKNKLEGTWDLDMLGYKYVSGSRGRGNSARFKWVGRS